VPTEIDHLPAALGKFGTRNTDTYVLAALSVVAGWVSWHYTGKEIPLPDMYAFIHWTAAGSLVASLVWPRLSPYSMALVFGSFVGRGLGIVTAAVLGLSNFPTSSLILAACQWGVLAWIIRPSFDHPQRLIEELGSEASRRVR